MIRKYDLVERQPLATDHDYCDSPNIVCLSEYKKAAISYIGGYVAQTVKKQVPCITCCRALGSRNDTADASFLKLKDRGFLFKATPSVLMVCEETEKCFQRMLM